MMTPNDWGFARENGRRLVRARDGLIDALRTGVAVQHPMRPSGVGREALFHVEIPSNGWHGIGQSIAEAFMHAWCGPLVCSAEPPASAELVRALLVCDRCGFTMRDHPQTNHHHEGRRVHASCDGRAIVFDPEEVVT